VKYSNLTTDYSNRQPCWATGLAGVSPTKIRAAASSSTDLPVNIQRLAGLPKLPKCWLAFGSVVWLKSNNTMQKQKYLSHSTFEKAKHPPTDNANQTGILPQHPTVMQKSTSSLPIEAKRLLLSLSPATAGAPASSFPCAVARRAGMARSSPPAGAAPSSPRRSGGLQPPHRRR
jgi:hypothetical protein